MKLVMKDLTHYPLMCQTVTGSGSNGKSKLSAKSQCFALELIAIVLGNFGAVFGDEGQPRVGRSCNIFDISSGY